MKKIFFFAILAISISCSTVGKRDYAAPVMSDDAAYLTIYRPHVFEAYLADYIITVNGKDLVSVEDQGYVTIPLNKGENIIETRHHQTKEKYTKLILKADPKQEYFLRLDPDVKKKFSWGGLVTDLLAVSTIVAGIKSEIRMESTGQGSLKDVSNVINGRQAQAEMAAHEKEDSIYHHLSFLVKKDFALSELSSCCSSERVSRDL